MTTDTEGRQDRPRSWWSYAPLIAFAVNVLWPNALFVLAVLGNKYARFESGSLIFGFVSFATANWAFVRLFFVARRKITEATEQRLPVQ